MAEKTDKLVHCRYPKCLKLHKTTELAKGDAVMGGSKNTYYHPDCWHTMQTINQIKDLFIHEINPAMTGQQIGILVSTINNLVFSKGIDVDFVKFALEYYVSYKPGSIKHPFGLHYAVQNSGVIGAWKKQQDMKLKEEIKASNKTAEQNDEMGEFIDLSNADFVYTPRKAQSFADILQ